MRDRLDNQTCDYPLANPYCLLYRMFCCKEQDMGLYVQTTFVHPIPPVRFVNSPSLVLLKSRVSSVIMKTLKQPQQAGEKEIKGKKVARIGLRLTPEDKVLLERRAQEAGHNTNEFIRLAALGLEVKQRLPTELKQVLLATSKNLNQYLKLAHMGRLDRVDEDALSRIIQAFTQAIR